jgi:hypothetical protein
MRVILPPLTRTTNLFTTPNPLLKQEGEFLNGGHQIFPLLFQEGVGGGKKICCLSQIEPPFKTAYSSTTGSFSHSCTPSAYQTTER